MTDVAISIEPNDRAMHTVRSRYDPDVVEIIKEGYVRSWDGPSKTWLVLDEEVPTLIERLEKAGHRVTRGDQPAPPPPVTEGALEGFFKLDKESRLEAEITAQALVDSIKPERRGAVFRAMGKILYPDLYGKGK